MPSTTSAQILLVVSQYSLIVLKIQKTGLAAKGNALSHRGIDSRKS